MEQAALERARQAVKSLFDVLEIRQVVCVDDVYAPSLAYVNEMVVMVGPVAAQQVATLSDLPLDSNDMWPGLLEQKWGELDEQSRVTLYRELRTLTQTRRDAAETEHHEEQEDVVAATYLEDIVRDHGFLALSPTQWRDRVADFLQTQDGPRTLFLFDVNLTHDGGATDGGIRLLQEFLALEHDPAPICGLLSHTFRGTEEQATADSLSAQLGISAGAVLPVSKDRLREDPLSFARGLKLTLINPYCHDLIFRATELMSSACNTAGERLKSIDVYDFEHIVFQASQREGIWEPDTLFRVFSLFQRQAARELARSDARLEELSGAMRRVTGIPTESPHAPHKSWTIQRFELYEDQDYLTRHHVPLDLGDIFETCEPADKPRRFVLLRQSCDLMVRGDGKRHPTVHEATLAELKRQLPTDLQGNPAGYDSHGILPYFDAETGDSWYVSYRKNHSVRLSVLDLCVYSDDGVARISVDQACAINLLPSWTEHFKTLLAEAKRVVGQAKELAKKGATKDQVRLVVPVSSLERLFASTVDTERGELAYNCRRIGRVCGVRAAALLADLRAYKSRPAFEVDYGVDRTDE